MYILTNRIHELVAGPHVLYYSLFCSSWNLVIGRIQLLYVGALTTGGIFYSLLFVLLSRCSTSASLHCEKFFTAVFCSPKNKIKYFCVSNTL